jgi:hypothetical protein
LEIGSLKFNIDDLADCINQPEKWFESYGKVYNTANGSIIYKDNGSKVLAVAHLDTVQNPSIKGIMTTTVNRVVTSKNIRNDFLPVKPRDPNTIVKPKIKPKPHKTILQKLITRKKDQPEKTSSPLMSNKKSLHCLHASGLDDRLGVFIILHLLPQIGANVDILFTTGEESGMSTAMHFADTVDGVKDKYNWMVEFDRRSDDLVMYEYESNEYSKLAEDAGFIVGVGSYTDICDLYSLEVAGFNIGTGYYRAHSINSFAILEITARNVTKFKKLYDTNHDTKLVSKVIKKRVRYTKSNNGHYGGYSWWGNDRYNTSSGYHSYGTGGGNKNTYDGPYYGRFECACGASHKWMRVGDEITCKCKIEYMRGNKTGHIYKITERDETGKVTKFVFEKTITSENPSTQKHNGSSKSKCVVCQAYKDFSVLNSTDTGRVCGTCEDAMFSFCMLCGISSFDRKTNFQYCEVCENSILKGEVEII